MPVRRPLRRRYRIMLWLDEALGPVQVAVATYVDDEKLTESTFGPEPFDQPGAVVDAAVRSLHAQLTLF